jgi:SAM-dependent methyltransferase
MVASEKNMGSGTSMAGATAVHEAVRLETTLVPTDLLFAALDSMRPGPSPSSPEVALGNGTCLVPLVALLDRLPAHAHAGAAGRHSGAWWTQIASLCGVPVGPMPLVSVLDRDRLILSEGVDSACRAKAAGRRWIRVQMPQSVFRQWKSRPIDRLRAVVRETRRREFYNPVFHPEFRKARTSRPESVRLDRISRGLATLGEGLRGLDIGCNMGYMTHALERLGLKMTAIDFDEYHLAVAEALSETYGLSPRFVRCQFQDFDAPESFDITLALSSLYHMFFTQNPERPQKVAERVGQLTRHALFWESGDQPEREIDLIRTHSGLSEYRSLGATQGTGKIRELGVFLRPGTDISRALASRYREQFGNAPPVA